MNIPDAPVVSLDISGKTRKFDLDAPELPDWIDDDAFGSANFPYDKKMKKDEYEERLEALQAELVKLQYWLAETGERIIAVFEGRDAAGKGGTIERIRENMKPRQIRNVALSKPSDVERGQWYFQRYAAHFPTSGEMVLFDRSWYNRAGVEPVMGFCSPEEHEAFLEEAPAFEAMIRREGIRFHKFWLNIGQQMQLKRFHERRHDPLKIWKLSPIDIKALTKWDDYSRARDRMLAETHRPGTPWTVIRANDKRRARLAAIQCILDEVDYDGKDRKRIGDIDRNIVRDADGFDD